MTTRMPKHILYSVPFIALLLTISIFAFVGNTHETITYGPSVVSWLVAQWRAPGSQCGHGWLVVLISGWFIYRKREELKRKAGRTWWPGALGVLLAFALAWVGARIQQPRLGVLAMMLTIVAAPAWLFGWRVGRSLLFPAAYLVWSMPMSFLINATLPLRLIASTSAAALLNGIGIGVVRNGTAIISTTPGRMAIDVAAACSGLQSIIALLALTCAYAYVSHRRLWARGMMTVAAVPLAIIGNIVRILVVAIVALTWGQEKAVAFSHDYSGYVVFVVAVLLMTMLSMRVKRWENKARPAAAEVPT